MPAASVDDRRHPRRSRPREENRPAVLAKKKQAPKDWLCGTGNVPTRRRTMGKGRPQPTIATLGGYDIFDQQCGQSRITSLVVDLKAEDLRPDVRTVKHRRHWSLGMKHAFFGAMRTWAEAQGTRRRPSSISPRSAAHDRHSRPLPGTPGTKSAVDRMTRVAAMEAGKLGYGGAKINCLYPGLVPTDMGMQTGRTNIVANRTCTGMPTPAVAIGRRAGRRLAGLGEVSDMADARRCFPLLQRGALHHRAGPGPVRRRHGHCKSPNAKNRNLGGYEHEREKGPVRPSMASSGYTGRLVCEISAGIQHSLYCRRAVTQPK